MSTFNALSVPKYADLVDWVFEMKTKHNSPDRHWVTSLTLDSAYLRYPTHQIVKILPKEWRDTLESIAVQMETLHTVKPLWEIEDWKDHYLDLLKLKLVKLEELLIGLMNQWMKKNKINFVETSITLLLLMIRGEIQILKKLFQNLQNFMKSVANCNGTSLKGKERIR